MKTSLRSALFILILILPLAALSAEKRTSLPLEHSPSRGPESAPVTIVEFIDFQ